MNESAFRQIVHAVVRRPASIHPMGPIAPEAMHWLLSRSPEVLTFGELDLILECEFEAALYYLPAAIRYIEQMRQEWPQVANFAIRFISSRQYEIGSLGIGSAMLERIYAVFDAVMSEFSVRSGDRDAWAAVVHGGERVDFVNSIFNYPLPCND